MRVKTDIGTITATVETMIKLGNAIEDLSSFYSANSQTLEAKIYAWVASQISDEILKNN